MGRGKAVYLHKKMRQNQRYKGHSRSNVRLCFMLLLAMAVAIPLTPNVVYGCDGCNGSPPWDIRSATRNVQEEHAEGRRTIKDHITQEFKDHQTWLVDEFFKKHVFPAMADMTVQLVSVGMQQVAAIGMFLDAEQQLEVQRTLQELQNQAHRDYQPSEGFCSFGTNVRSVAASEERARQNTNAFNAMQMSRHLAKTGTAGADSPDHDKLIRWSQFQTAYCDPNDNNKVIGDDKSGLTPACGLGGSADPDRLNIDIDFTRLIEGARTLNVNFFEEDSQDGSQGGANKDEQDVIALGQNLYGHDVLSRDVAENYLGTAEYQALYMKLRSVAAKRNVAQNSYNAIVGMKSSGTAGPEGEAGTEAYLGAVIKDLGVSSDDEIFAMIGTSPSYYAQLEILAKKIYQNPDFFANLYDKPANVKRKGVALKAIELMLDRAIYESQLRQEMAMSVLLSAKLDNHITGQASE